MTELISISLSFCLATKPGVVSSNENALIACC